MHSIVAIIQNKNVVNLLAHKTSIQRFAIEDIYFHKGGFRCINNHKFLPKFNYYWFNGTSNCSFLNGLIYYYGHLHAKKLIDPLKYHMISKDKFVQYLCLKHYDLPTPQTSFFYISSDNINTCIDIIENSYQYPFIAKNPKGARGKGVFLIKNKKEATDIFQRNHQETLLVQEFIPNQGDIRAIIIGNKYIGATKRFNQHSFKNNVAKGGTTTAYTLNLHTQNICIHISKFLGLDVTGIDLMHHNGKYICIEINDMPDHQAFEKVLNVDIDKEIHDFLNKHSN